MKTIFAKHLPYDDGHLGEVVSYMRLSGAPTIRVVRHDGDFCATEGSHRIAAAHFLGEMPKLVIEEAEVDGLGEFWGRVRERIPGYAFSHVMVLDLATFRKG